MKRHRHLRADLPELAEALRQKSRKLTGPRRAILEILHRHPHPMSSKQIYAALPHGTGDLVTVYRLLHLLETMNLVKRYDLGDGVARFELLAKGDDGHHHHLVCTRCAKVVEIQECFTRRLERRIAASTGFKSLNHRLEFFGVCPQCQ